MPVKDKAYSSDDAHFEFLHWIDVLAPEVRDRLKDLVPDFRPCFAGRGPFNELRVFPYLIAPLPSSDARILNLLDPTCHPHIDPYYLTPDRQQLLDGFHSFRNGFVSILKQYNLDGSEWIAKRFFEYVINAYSGLAHKLANARPIVESPYVGDEINWNGAGWEIGEVSSKQFVTNTMKRFSENLKDYIKMTEHKARLAGHPDSRGIDIEPVKLKFLVKFTVLGLSDNEVVVQMQKEGRTGADMRSWSRQKKRWAELGLPVRCTKKRGNHGFLLS
jgi:hypothetical protein